jgi:preprotein translocase subunit SecE
MARNRQRAKQRQAERRARRLADQQRGGDGQARAEAPSREAVPGDGEPVVDPRHPELATGAPPEELGRSDEVLEPVASPGDEQELLDEELEDFGGEEAVAEETVAEEAFAPRGRRGAPELGGEPTAVAKDRPRFVQFLIAVWAELQRVQWPNRQALTTLTGVVLGFVLIAGGYLGLLDAIFSRIIQAIL